MPEQKSELKGFLSLLILWMLSKRSMNGAQIGQEIERRKGARPSPGTIYPALKDLKSRGLISAGAHKEYTLTAKGKKELEQWLSTFCTIFADFNEMKSSCKGSCGK